LTAILPDAAPANWVDRFAPAALRPWLKLGRLDRPTGIFLLLLPGWQAIALAGAMHGRGPDQHLLLLFLIGATLMRAAGCAFNDIVDRDVDAKVARTAARPIPSGQISVAGAWAFLVGCSLVSLLILLSFNLLSLYLGILSLALVAAYPFMKRITWWPQAWLGLTFNWGALLGFAATLGGPAVVTVIALAFGAHAAGSSLQLVTGLLPWPPVLLYLSGVFWTLGYDTIYSVQDLEDDALVGVKSSARRLGAATSRGVFVFYAIAITLALSVGWTAHLGLAFYGLTAAYAVHLIHQARSLKTDDPALALALFKSNAIAGVILFAGLILAVVKF